MRRRSPTVRAIYAVAAATFAAMALGCAREEASVLAAVGPEALAEQTCGACGMVVREQPAPRGQVVYRDGHHAHACSASDLALLAQAPSPRGRPVGVYLEAQDALETPLAPTTAPQPQRAVADLQLVVGVARAGVMGQPALAFAAAPRAAATATAAGGRVVSWSAYAAEVAGAHR